MRYILDNVLVQTEAIEWSKVSKQDLILLKLDFKKAYDTLSLLFLFSVMHKVGFPSEFIDLVYLLFTGVKASVCINEAKMETFQIARGVRQRCLLAPYLFLLVGQALNSISETKMSKGLFRGISLPDDLG